MAKVRRPGSRLWARVVLLGVLRIVSARRLLRGRRGCFDALMIDRAITERVKVDVALSL